MNLLVQDIWEQVVEGFVRLHGKALRDLWLQHTRPLSFTKGLFVLGVPNLFIREWLEKKYLDDLEKLFLDVTGCPVKIMLKIDGYLYRLMKENQGALKTEPVEQKIDDREAARFVVRPENRLVHSAFERILREPPGTFNPLYFYGPNGVGKTHLVQQFLKKARRVNRFPAWHLVGAEKFAREFHHAARIGDRVRFRGAILHCDLLIIEDVQEMEGKLKIQMELLSILKYLTERSRQVVITSACHPRDIQFMQNSLASFLLSGMVVSVAGYGLNSAVEILSARCKEKGLQVPPPLVETVARSSNGGLHGFMELIEQVLKLADLKGDTPSPAFLKEHFPEYSSVGIGEDAVDRIINLVSKKMRVERELVTSNVKIRKVVLARHLVIYLASSLLRTPSRRICRWLGNISPSIVPYARKKIDGRRRNDEGFNRLVLELQSEVEGGQKYLF
ncbi:MAG: DnaA ATPase domain-containing protein [Planctomycetota bacterium]